MFFLVSEANILFRPMSGLPLFGCFYEKMFNDEPAEPCSAWQRCRRETRLCKVAG